MTDTTIELMDNPPSQKEMDNDFLNVSSIDDREIEKNKIKKLVSNIWRSENTLNKLLDILQDFHEGDRIPLMTILLAYIQGKITNMEETVYFTIHAEAGEGKSHIFQTGSSILPEQYVFDTGFSDKFLTRAKNIIPDGSIICFDDRSFSTSVVEIMKICTNRKRNPIYCTLEGRDNKPQQYELPKCLNFITIRVDQIETPDYEQIMSRNILVYADSSSMHIKKVCDLIRKRGSKNYNQDKIDLGLLRQFLWDNFPAGFNVDVSIAKHLGCSKGISARQIEQCISLMKMFAVFHQWDGEYNGKDIHDNVVSLTADKEDFNAAINFYNDTLKGKGGDQIFHLTPTGNKILQFLKFNYPDSVIEYPSFTELAKDMGMNTPSGRRSIQRALYGREGSNGKERTKHVLGTVPGISGDKYNETISEYEYTQTSRKTYNRYPIIWNGKEYQTSCPYAIEFYWTEDELRPYGE